MKKLFPFLMGLSSFSLFMLSYWLIDSGFFRCAGLLGSLGMGIVIAFFTVIFIKVLE